MGNCLPGEENQMYHTALPRSIGLLQETVRAAGAMALQAQQCLDFSTRALKDDGSILTGADRQVEQFLLAQIGATFPQANLLGEESAHTFDPARPFTFAIDPIDGTDAFSQGMPGWCVSVGLLDHTLRPVGGILCAPRWDSFFFADIAGPATHNGQIVSFPPAQPALSSRSNLFVHSTIHQGLNLDRFPGKIRNVGSSALQMCFPLIYPGVVGTVSGRVYAWDLAAAHAVLLAASGAVEYLDGNPIDYAPLLRGQRARKQILSGSRQGVDLIRAALIGRRPTAESL